jgi:hypothetical protein
MFVISGAIVGYWGTGTIEPVSGTWYFPEFILISPLDHLILHQRSYSFTWTVLPVRFPGGWVRGFPVHHHIFFFVIKIALLTRDTAGLKFDRGPGLKLPVWKLS